MCRHPTWHASSDSPNRQLIKILDGEPVMLEAGGHAFPGVYTDAVTKPVQYAAIILHGRGMHPDWTQLAGPLRIGSPEQG